MTAPVGSRNEPAGAPVRVLFVGGLGRSGSTLLELLLAQHPDVCAVGEVVHLWERALGGDERCGCGERFTGCGFWQQVGAGAFGGWAAVDPAEVRALRARVDRTRHIPRLAGRRLGTSRRDQVREYTSRYTRIYRTAAELTGAQVVVDSSKHASLAFALHWADRLDLRVVHLVRDSRAVAWSWGRRVRRPEVVDVDAYMPVSSPVTVSTLWTAQNLAFHLLARRVPVLRLRYEDLAAAPADTLRRVRAFAGLPDDPAALRLLADPTVPARRTHSIAGNPLRFRDGPLVVRPDETWRTALPRSSRTLVSLATWPLRLRYGYLGPIRPGGQLLVGRRLATERREHP